MTQHAGISSSMELRPPSLNEAQEDFYLKMLIQAGRQGVAFTGNATIPMNAGLATKIAAELHRVYEKTGELAGLSAHTNYFASFANHEQPPANGETASAAEKSK